MRTTTFESNSRRTSQNHRRGFLGTIALLPLLLSGCDTLLETTPQETASSFTLSAKQSYDQHNYAKAIEFGLQATQADPTHGPAWYWTGLAYFADNQYDNAIAALQKAIEVKAPQKNTHYFLGCAFKEKKQYEQAVIALHRAVEFEPNDPFVHNQLGLCYHLTERYDEAIEEFQRAADLKPDEPAFTRNLSSSRQAAQAFRQNPSLEKLLVSKEPAVSVARNRTRMLVQQKNETLPKLLREGKTSELRSLAVKIEQVILDLSHEAELAKDQAQSNLEAGTKDVQSPREFALIYKERIEVLKPMLVAIKEELANRSR